MQTPPGRKDDKVPKDDLTAEEVQRLNMLTGNVPPEGGDVYTGEIRMFPSPGDYLNVTQDQFMRSSVNLEEGADDEDEYNEFESTL